MAAIETLAAALPPGLVIVADSGLGHLENLCAANDAHMRFVVPLRADTAGRPGSTPTPARSAAWPRSNGWTMSPAGSGGCRRASATSGRACCARSRSPAKIPAPGTTCVLPTSGRRGSGLVADARERALAKAEAALGRIRDGLSSRYYKTRKQVDARVAQILTGQAASLITVRTGAKAGKPWITWARDAAAIADASRLDRLYTLAADLPDPSDGTR